MITKFKNREDMISHYLTESMVGAELGVFKGDFSKTLLKTNPSKLYLVDVFEGFAVSGDKDGLNMQSTNLNDSFAKLNHVYSNDDRVVVVKSKSVDFLKSLDDDSLDFVYIDADHSYEAVKTDITLSYEKVKNSGYILGHDYTWQNNHPFGNNFEGVVRAVDEFCKEHSIKIEGLSQCGCPSFCIPIMKV